MNPPAIGTKRDVNRTSLANGLRIITEPMGHVRSVAMGIWIGTGSRRENLEQNGISHFLEHMLFKGTENRSAEEIAKVVDSTGGNLDAYTAKELVSYNTKVIDDHLTLGFDVLADLVLRPLFQPEEIEKEKGVILEELKMEVDNPEYLVHETFFSRFWKKHPLGRSILGTKASIGAFSQEAVRAYHSDVYVPANIVITAAGRIEHAQIVDLVDKYFGQLSPGTPPPSEPVPQTQIPLILKSKRSLEQVHLCIGVPALPIAHPQRYACYLLSTILGGGMSSRLFQNVREKHGLAYSIFTELNLYRDAGCLAVYSGTSTAHVRKVVGMVVDEFRSIANDRIPDEELRRAKDHLKGSLALGLESTSSRMSNLARQELFFGRFYTVDEMVEAVEQVTAEEVQEIARLFFSGKQVGATVLGRVNGIELSPDELRC
ncbi:MAG: insulinase family protein [Bryobacteraceae bacterium]|nr:insulinase family protein [Bryobacteraceae bacterium]